MMLGPLLVCVCTCISIWGSNKGALIFKQFYSPPLQGETLHHMVVLCRYETGAWLHGPWRVDFSGFRNWAMDTRCLANAFWRYLWKKDIFLPLQTVEVPITLTRYMHTDVLNCALCATSLKFKVVAHQWSLDETLLRWILQVPARQNLVVIFILFHN